MQELIGKKVKVSGVDTPFQRNVNIVGICTFIGINEFLNKKQATVGRMPIFLNDYGQVKLYEDEGILGGS